MRCGAGRTRHRSVITGHWRSRRLLRRRWYRHRGCGGVRRRLRWPGLRAAAPCPQEPRAPRIPHARPRGPGR
eukprot:1229731-Heterocapsa_arctica.AAC.1